MEDNKKCIKLLKEQVGRKVFQIREGDTYPLTCFLI